MRCIALPPRYALPVVGFSGMSSEASAGFHGFCHGATPVSSMLMMRSVTSCRKSRLAARVPRRPALGLDLLTLPWSSALLSRGELRFGFFVFEPGPGQRLSTNVVQWVLARSTEERQLVPHTRTDHWTVAWPPV